MLLFPIQSDLATLKHLWSPDVAGLCYRDEMAVAIYAVQVASTVARELQEELCQQGAIRHGIMLMIVDGMIPVIA